jgi:predicted DNA-binding transcriptional regulator AlpA
MELRLLTVEEAAAAVQLPQSALYRLRHQGRGPLCFKVGRRLVYPELELKRWLADRIVRTSVGGNEFTGDFTDSVWIDLRDEQQ